MKRWIDYDKKAIQRPRKELENRGYKGTQVNSVSFEWEKALSDNLCVVFVILTDGTTYATSIDLYITIPSVEARIRLFREDYDIYEIEKQAISTCKWCSENLKKED